MSEELKPCPFCGSPAELIREHNEYVVRCQAPYTCYGSAAEGGSYGFEFAAAARALWNKRSPSNNTDQEKSQ